MVGSSDGAPILTLGTDDVRAAYERLQERGVRFLGEPYRYPWGIGALLLDQDGSPILLQQESGRTLAVSEVLLMVTLSSGYRGKSSSREDWMTRQTMLWPLGVAVGFLALIGVGASVAHYLQEPYNPGFLDSRPSWRCTWSWADST